ncbi:MAG TPA: hypothetical protein VJ385_19685 [Fibrobacteria bacterium]|nr:hypothetical protein [Fibrobacteria bacterium]
MRRVLSFSALSNLFTFATLARPGAGALVAAALLLGPLRSEANQSGEFGLGFIAGNPSGLSGKLWVGPDNALDFTAGFSIVNDWIYLDADYVWHEWSLIPVKKGRLPLYYGPGVWTSISDEASIGIRGVVGLEYIFPTTPFDVFLEIAPGISVLPSTNVDVSAGLGMRFFF